MAGKAFLDFSLAANEVPDLSAFCRAFSANIVSAVSLYTNCFL